MAASRDKTERRRMRRIVSHYDSRQSAMLPVLSFIIAIVFQQASLSITVRHDGVAVSGATVTCATAKVETDAQGKVSVPVPEGGCTLTVAREGLTPFSQPVTVTS